PMPELLDAMSRPAQTRRQALGLQHLQRLFHRRIVVVHHRLAAGFLIARVDQSVQRERIVFRRGDVFLQERPQHANLDRMKWFHLGQHSESSTAASTTTIETECRWFRLILKRSSPTSRDAVSKTPSASTDSRASSSWPRTKIH